MRMLLLLLFLAFPATAQRPGGTLQVHHRDSPGSLSIHEETTNAAIVPVNARAGFWAGQPAASRSIG
jgi:hypothetical protein